MNLNDDENKGGCIDANVKPFWVFLPNESNFRKMKFICFRKRLLMVKKLTQIEIFHTSLILLNV
jgi:hypothetical protein